MGGVVANEQNNFMALPGQKIRQFSAKLAGGEVGQPPHLIQRLVGRPGCDDAFHARQVSRIDSEREQENFGESAKVLSTGTGGNAKTLRDKGLGPWHTRVHEEIMVELYDGSCAWDGGRLCPGRQEG